MGLEGMVIPDYPFDSALAAHIVSYTSHESPLSGLHTMMRAISVATPDDIEAYEAIQRGVQATADPHGDTADWNDISRGLAAERAGLPYDERLQGVVSRSIDEAAIRSFWRSWAERVR